MLFFQLNTWLLAIILLAILAAATLIGLSLGRAARKKSEDLREAFSVIQGTLLGFHGPGAGIRPEPSDRAIRNTP